MNVLKYILPFLLILFLSACVITPEYRVPGAVLNAEVLSPLDTAISLEEWNELLAGFAESFTNRGQSDQKETLINLSAKLNKLSAMLASTGQRDRALRLGIKAIALKDAATMVAGADERLTFGMNMHGYYTLGYTYENYLKSLEHLSLSLQLDGFNERLKRHQARRDADKRHRQQTGAVLKELAWLNAEAQRKRELKLMEAQEEKRLASLSIQTSIKEKKPQPSLTEISGAFGVRLGQSHSVNIPTQITGDNKYIFSPLFPARQFSKHWYLTTPASKKIVEIIAAGPELAAGSDCKSKRNQIAESLEKKHGRRAAMEKSGNFRHTIMIKQGNKQINISCESSYTPSFEAVLKRPFLRIKYSDRDLLDLFWKEDHLMNREKRKMRLKAIKKSVDSL